LQGRDSRFFWRRGFDLTERANPIKPDSVFATVLDYKNGRIFPQTGRGAREILCGAVRCDGSGAGLQWRKALMEGTLTVHPPAFAPSPTDSSY
jgi:hypothetical protein